MAESLILTTPVVISTVDYSVRRVDLDWDAQHISIRVKGSDGSVTDAVYEGAIALTLLRQLNKADLSAKSLQRRILERLVVDGKLPSGSVTGIPD